MTDNHLRIGLAQINPTVGDLDGNFALMAQQIEAAREQNVQLLVFPELALCGYPPEDLLLRPGFLRDCDTTLHRLAQLTAGMVVLCGTPHLHGRHPYNAAAVLADGDVRDYYHKHHLPTYGVFDEDRYFRAGQEPLLLTVGGTTVGVTICEDIWYDHNPLAAEALAGAELIVNLSASPYHQRKGVTREQLLAQRARDHLVPIAYCNMVGGQDELIFDGQSFVVDHHGTTVARAPQFAPHQLVYDLNVGPVLSARLHDARYRKNDVAVPIKTRALTATPSKEGIPTVQEPLLQEPLLQEPLLQEPLAPLAEAYGALVLGVHDYVTKNGFNSVLLGLSGGIDSALVALVAVDALGAEAVRCVVMPSVWSSDATQTDAHILARNLGCDSLELPIAAMVTSYEQALFNEFAGTDTGVTEENIQARIRGNLLMALSNKNGAMVLSTGNKSEMSVGYATLYGDMAGGLAVIKDVPKTLVFELTRWRDEQAGGTLVPAGIIDRPPSAELAPDQADTDSLPPYDVLDPILARYIENDESVQDIIDAGFDTDVVRRVAGLVDRAEYKRRQSPPGLKITSRNFGRDRRMPITNRYR